MDQIQIQILAQDYVEELIKTVDYSLQFVRHQRLEISNFNMDSCESREPLLRAEPSATLPKSLRQSESSKPKAEGESNLCLVDLT